MPSECGRLLYKPEDFNPMAARRKKYSLMLCTSAPVCAAQLSTVSYSTHPYILGNKRKRKEADNIFIHQCCHLYLLHNSCSHPYATRWLKNLALMKENKIITKHIFLCIFLCNGIKHISLDYRYNFWSCSPESVEVSGWKKLIIHLLYIICTPNFWDRKSGKIVHLIHKWF